MNAEEILGGVVAPVALVRGKRSTSRRQRRAVHRNCFSEFLPTAESSSANWNCPQIVRRIRNGQELFFTSREFFRCHVCRVGMAQLAIWCTPRIVFGLIRSMSADSAIFSGWVGCFQKCLQTRAGCLPPSVSQMWLGSAMRNAAEYCGFIN